MTTVIEQIQENDPSYDPLTIALEATGTTESLWKAACSRIYHDGYYGPISAEEWEEQDGRQPYTVTEAIKVVATVLDKVESYSQLEYCDEEEDDIPCTGHEIDYVEAGEIKAALVPWYKEIYGQRYPQL